MATKIETRPAGATATETGLRGIHHLALNTDDMKKTTEFYVGVLGMKLVHTLVTPSGGMDRAKTRGNPPFECIRHYFFDMGGDSLLAFFELPKSQPKGDRNALATMQHLAFAVSEERYDDILARLKKHNVAIADGPLNAVPPDTWSFYFFDPNGIRLEIATDKGQAQAERPRRGEILHPDARGDPRRAGSAHRRQGVDREDARDRARRGGESAPLRPQGRGSGGRWATATPSDPRWRDCRRRRRCELKIRRRARDLRLLLRHLGGNVGEKRRRQIALSRIRQHGEDGRALRRVLRHLERASHGAARRDADEDAFLARQLAAVAQRVGVRDAHDLVDQLEVDRIAGDLRDVVRRPALHRVRLERRDADSERRAVLAPLLRNAGGQHRRLVRLAHDDLGVRHLLAQHAADALERAAGAEAGDPIIELLALEIVDDLARRGARMVFRVGLVLELARLEPAVLRRELARFVDHAVAALRRRGEDHLGAEEAHQLAPLDRERFRHGDDQRIALLGAHHGEADAGVARGGLDHGLARLERAVALRRFDHAEGEAVLDRAERIEGLDLDPQIDARRRHLRDPDDRGVAHSPKDVLEFRHVALPLFAKFSPRRS